MERKFIEFRESNEAYFGISLNAMSLTLVLQMLW